MGEKKLWPITSGNWVIWLGLALAAVFLYLIRSILPPFLIGALLAYVLGPVVASIESRWRLPRPLATAVLYLGVLTPLVLFFVLLGPRLFGETRLLIVRSPVIVARLIGEAFGPGPYTIFGDQLTPAQISDDLIGSVREALGTPTAVLHVATGVATGVLDVFLSLVVSIYLLLDSERVNRALMGFVPWNRREHVAAVSEEIHRTLARYLRRQMVLVGLVAAATFIGLEFVFHLHYALPVAVATGFLEIVPFFGPVVAGAIATLIALSSPEGATLAIKVIVFYIVLRQVEDQIVMPLVLGRAVELHPLVVIFAVLAGSVLAGVIGTLLAVPVAASIKVILDAWPKLQSNDETLESPELEAVGPLPDG